MSHQEKIEAIRCPKCGSTHWKRHNVQSCSVVPFEAECAKCGYIPDDKISRALCPYKSFSFRLPGKIIVRHLKCYICGKEKEEFEAIWYRGYDHPQMYIHEEGTYLEEKWILPDEWTVAKVLMDIGDGEEVPTTILLCSDKCRTKAEFEVIDEERDFGGYTGC